LRAAAERHAGCEEIRQGEEGWMIAKCRFQVIDVGVDGLGARLCAAYPRIEAIQSLVSGTGPRYFFAWSNLESHSFQPRPGDFVELTALEGSCRVSVAPNERAHRDEERFAVLLDSVDEWGSGEHGC
jgi:hypothetical protein